MSCMEYHCTNQKCGWTEMSNNRRDECPVCKSPVHWFFDEQESPRGDDYDDNSEDE